jgi:adenylyltransferase/sulfurtransferase
VGRPKTESAGERLGMINPHVRVEKHPVRFGAANARELVRGYEIVVDGTDNFPARYLINDACVLERRPLVHGAILRWEGQASVFATAKGPCYRCLFPEPPEPGSIPSCSEAGVLGVLPGIIGSIQAAEVVKLLLGAGQTLVGRLLLFDALAMTFREMRLPRNPACTACGDRPSIREAAGACTAPSPAPSAVDPGAVPEITPTELHARLERGESLAVVDVREPWEWEIGNLAAHGARLIPMNEVPERLDEIPRDRPVVLQCRSGVRSARVLDFLRENGFTDVHNLAGGILAWSEQVDPSVPKY